LTLALYLVPLAIRSTAAGGISNDTVNVYSSLGSSFYDQYYGTSLPEVQQGASLVVAVTFTPSYACPRVGCNMSVGFAFDTVPNYTTSASGYTNASNANPRNTFTALPGQSYVVEFSVIAPLTASNLVMHQYQVDIVNYAKANNASSAETLLDTMGGTIGVISPTQQSYWFAQKNLTTLSDAYSSVFSSILSSPNGYHYSPAVNFLIQSSTMASKANMQYSEGNFAGANASEVLALGQYQQAVQSYQSGASSLDSSNNNYLSLVPYGVILLGIGAVVAGIGLAIGAFRKSA
jgi:hypothetical protein